MFSSKPVGFGLEVEMNQHPPLGVQSWLSVLSDPHDVFGSRCCHVAASRSSTHALYDSGLVEIPPVTPSGKSSAKLCANRIV